MNKEQFDEQLIENNKLKRRNKNLRRKYKKLDKNKQKWKTFGIVTGGVLAAALLTTGIVTPLVILKNKTPTVTKFNVEFETNGGTACDVQVIESGKKAIQPNSQKDNWWLEGWYEDAQFQTGKFDFTQPIKRNVKLYAKWKEDVQPVTIFQVTFHANYDGGTDVVADINQHHTAVAASMSRTGYALEGWYTEKECQNKYVFTTPVEKNTDLYAKWDIAEFKVSFDTNGGSTIDPVEAAYNGIITEPTNPTKTGYTFGTWCTDAALQNPYDFTTKITSSFTLYAKWTTNSYTVTFNTDGAVEPIQPQSVEFNKQATNPGTITKTGYNFVGWYSDSEKTKIFSFDTPITQNMTIYAKWEIVKCTITYDTNGGTSVDPTTVEYGSTISKPTCTKTGYVCNHWYTDSSLSTEYTFSQQVTSSFTLYAKWDATQITVKFNTDEAAQTIADQTIDYDTVATDPGAITKTGYTFVGWYSDSAKTEPFSFTTHLKADTTLYAKWQINTYTVTYISNGGSYVAAQSVNHGSSITAPTAPTRTGYKFDYWCTDEALKTQYTFGTTVTQSFSLYAKWTETPATSITISGATDKQEYDVGSSSNVEVTLSASIEPATAAQNIVWTSTSTNANITFDSTTHKVTAPANAVGIMYVTAASADLSSLVYKTIQLRFYDSSLITFSGEETLTATIPSGSTEENIIIPKTYNEKTITSIVNASSNINTTNTTLKSINVPEGVTELKYYVDSETGASTNYGFINCTNLQDVELPDSLTTIGAQAFSGCTSLTTITIPKGVTSISTSAFNNTPNLASFEVAEDNSSYCSVDGVLMSKDKTKLIAVPASKAGSYTIPSTVTEISGNAFKGSSLSSIVVPDTVTTLGTSAFANATALTNLTLGSGISTIPTNCFSNCTNLKSVTLPDSVTTISSNAFAFSGVTSLDLTNVTTLSDYACQNASNLTTVTIGSSITEIPGCAFRYTGLTSMTVPDTVTSIGVNAFEECTSLTSLTIGTGTTVIPNGMCNGCIALSSVTINGSITEIASAAFQNCKSLYNITLPSSLTKVGKAAFGIGDESFRSSIETIIFSGTQAQWGAVNYYYLVWDSSTQTFIEYTTPFGTSSRPECFPPTLTTVECTDGDITYS